MYLVGTFRRDYFGFGANDDPMSLVGVKTEIDRETLQKAAQDDDYQVINVLDRTYFDPKQNTWVKLKDF